MRCDSGGYYLATNPPWHVCQRCGQRWHPDEEPTPECRGDSREDTDE